MPVHSSRGGAGTKPSGRTELYTPVTASYTSRCLHSAVAAMTQCTRCGLWVFDTSTVFMPCGEGLRRRNSYAHTTVVAPSHAGVVTHAKGCNSSTNSASRKAFEPDRPCLGRFTPNSRTQKYVAPYNLNSRNTTAKHPRQRSRGANKNRKARRTTRHAARPVAAHPGVALHDVCAVLNILIGCRGSSLDDLHVRVVPAVLCRIERKRGQGKSISGRCEFDPITGTSTAACSEPRDEIICGRYGRNSHLQDLLHVFWPFAVRRSPERDLSRAITHQRSFGLCTQY